MRPSPPRRSLRRRVVRDLRRAVHGVLHVVEAVGNSLQPRRPVPRVAALLSATQESQRDGLVQVTIRAQHDFWPDDLTFEGTDGLKGRVFSLFLADVLVLSSPDGIPFEVFENRSTLRHHLAGHFIQAGCDITVSARIQPRPDLVVPHALTVTITGQKPLR